MAIGKLPVDYVQDVIDTTVTDKRRYKMITNTDGTMSLDDVTTYVLEGTEFGADDINQTNRTVNDVIDEIEGIENGTITVEKASCAGSAERADNATNATNATNAENAANATSAETAKKLSTPKNINGVAFDGTEDITVKDDTKVPLDKDFILINQEELIFTDNVATITDERITGDSLADVYFTADTMSAAQKASIDVDTYDGYLTLTAGRTPERVLKASIHVRVV